MYAFGKFAQNSQGLECVDGGTGWGVEMALVHVHCRDFNIFSSHGLLLSDFVVQSVERRSLCGPFSISRASAHMVYMG